MSDLGEFQNDFFEHLNKENAKRLQVIAGVILLVVTFQLLSYVLSESEMYGNDLIMVKVIIMLAGILVIGGLHQLRRGHKLAVKYSRIIIFVFVFVMILLSIINTFYAQQITNDISIYMMVLMAVMSGSRMAHKSVLIILVGTYLIFAIGMTFFQTNPIYLFSHLFNGALTNVLVFLISGMFYRYSLTDYKDKLDIDQKNIKLKELSEKDDLTGLYNKRAIYFHLDKLIDKAKTDDEQLYLGILDLDHFKAINDHYGHLYGDEVLKQVANKILENVRKEDLVGRYGGDEFIIIFHDCSKKTALNTMTLLLDKVNQLEFTVGRLSFSCGIAVWNGESSDKLFERADTYMYDVKRSGKNDIKLEQLEVVNS